MLKTILVTIIFSGKIDVDIDCIIHLASPNYDYAKDDSLKNGITTLTKKILCAMPQYNCKKIIFLVQLKFMASHRLNKIFL